MLKAAVGQVEGIDTLDVIRKVIKQATENLGQVTPQAGILFAGIEFDHQLLLKELHKILPDLELIGCTTAGNFTSDFKFSEFSVSLLLFYSNDIEIKIGLGPNVRENPQEAVKTALESARKKLKSEEKLCFFFPDGAATESNQLLTALESSLSPKCQTFGGCSARHGAFNTPPKQFYKQQVVQNSLPLMLIAGDIDHAFSISHSWSPVGKIQNITTAKGKELEKIGNTKALDYFKNYLGTHSQPSSEFPLAIYEENNQEFYLRVPVAYNEQKGSVSFGAYLPEKAEVQLTKATSEQILQNSESSILEAKNKYPGSIPAAALVFSCNARKGILGTKAAQELELLQKHLPQETPITGFYGFAEFSPLSPEKKCQLHHTTMVTLLIGDRNQPTITNQKNFKNAVVEKKSGIKTNKNLEEELKLVSKKLQYSEYQRHDLEKIKESNVSILQVINEEIEQARQEIQDKNEELQRIYQQLQQEKLKSDGLLLNILPEAIAEELKLAGQVEPVFHDSVSVLFTDFQGFTKVASQMKPGQLLQELDYFFTAFDQIIEKHGLEKLKTIGDAYMCAGGIVQNFETHVFDIIQAAWEIKLFMEKERAQRLSKGQSCWNIRIGVHTGPLMAGVIGKRKFAFDVWGDTVNIASRLESSSEPGKINISQDVYQLIKEKYHCTYRGKIDIKNRGVIDMYFVDNPK